MEMTIQNIDLPQEYGVTDACIFELALKYQDLTEIKDSASLAMAVAGRREARELRVAVEKKRKELKADVLEFGRAVDGEAKRITEKLREIEDPLDGLIKGEEARRQAEKEERERQERERILAEQRRIDAIQAAIETRFGDTAMLAFHGLSAAGMVYRLDQETEISEADGFEEFTAEARKRQAEFIAQARVIHGQKIAAEEEAERQRIEAERLAEERRKIEEEQRAIEEQRRKEQEQLEAERRKLREEQEAIEAEKRRIEEERQAKEREEQEAKARAEFEERTRIQAEKEAEAKKVREEQERKDREDAARLAREREEMLRPDKEKLKLFALDLHALKYPTVTTAEGIKALERIKKKVYALADFVSLQADKLAEAEEVEVS